MGNLNGPARKSWNPAYAFPVRFHQHGGVFKSGQFDTAIWIRLTRPHHHFNLVQAKKRIHIRVSIGYTTLMATKNAGLRIRVERTLREEFLQTCRAEDKPAAQVIREFMRQYVSNRQTDAQRSLFATEPHDGSR